MNHEHYMSKAIELAKKAWGQTHPNPHVGAVIVEDGEVVASGYHKKAGRPHAEREALADLGRKPKAGAVMYVTLEPCCTTGRTPPCVEGILEAGIKTVVVGATDPNPKHAGHGFDILRSKGVEVITGVLEKRCDDLNLIFNHRMQTGEPFFAAKVATTLDGKVATREGHSKWITGKLARANVHHWRKYFTGIAVGANTVLADDPSLTVREGGEAVGCPVRFVFDSSLRTVAAKPKVYTDEFKERTIVLTSERADAEAAVWLEGQGVQTWMLPTCEHGLDLKAFREQCKASDIWGVYFEGGAGLHSSMLAQGQMDYLFQYIAAKFLADSEAKSFLGGQTIEKMGDAYELENVVSEVFGVDVLFRGVLKR